MIGAVPEAGLALQEGAPVLKDCGRVWPYRDGKGERQERRCRNPRCCFAGRDRWARRIAAVLRRSFRTRPPTHEVRLTIFGRGAGDLLRALRRMLARLKYQLRVRQGAEFEFSRIIEWSPEGQVHAHLVLRTTGDLTEDTVRELWLKSCPAGGASSHCEPARSAVALAKYVVKDLLKDEDKTLVPAGFRGRVFSCSRNFLTARAAALWRACLNEWYSGEQDHHR
jgi:hypothetical protein